MTPEMFGVTADLANVLTVSQLGWSVVLLLAALGLRWIVVRIIRARSVLLTEVQRWWIAATRNAATLAIVIGLVVIWSDEIEAFALSITAFAVALAIVTKELILCIAGAIWRGGSNAFEIGDWIDIGPHSGEVIDETPFTTVLQQFDHDSLRLTGRTVVVPNAMLFTQPVVNHHFRKRFLFHHFKITAEPGGDPEAVRAAIETALQTASDDFRDVASRYAQMIGKRTGVRLPDVAPEVSLGTTDNAKVVFRCQLFCPREEVVALETVAHQAWLSADGMRHAGGG